MIELEQPRVESTPEPEVKPEPKKRGKYDVETGRLKLDVAETALLVLERFEQLHYRHVTGWTSTRNSIKLSEELLGNDFYLADKDLVSRMEGGSKYSPGRIGANEIPQSELAESGWPMSRGCVALYDDDLV